MGWWPFGKKKKDETVDGVLSQSAAQSQPADTNTTPDPAATTATTTTSTPTDTPADTSSQGLSSVPSPLNPDTDTLKPADDTAATAISDAPIERSVAIDNLPEYPAAANTSDGPEPKTPDSPDQSASGATPPAMPTPTATDDTTPDQPTPPAQP